MIKGTEDDHDINTIFRWAEENKTTPKTAAITAERLDGAVRPVLEAGDDVILFTIASGMSSTYNLAQIYSEDNGNGHMYVVDSANLSTGIGLLVIKAAEMAAAGASAEEIVRKMDELIPNVRASFVLDTLVYLARGGRCSSAAALLAGTLKLHPEIVVKDGAMGADKKYRGSLAGAIVKYTRDLENTLKNADPDRVFITHTLLEKDRAIVDETRKYLESLGVFKEILETRAGGVIASHCGPGTLGVLFIEKA